MIAKNTADEVLEHTSAAAQSLSGINRTMAKDSIVADVISSLSEVCKLKGVGPATGTLILSVFKPDLVTFFQDETFHWLCDASQQKLKYDKKEYTLLLSRSLDLIIDQDISAQGLEKSAYVLMHSEHLTEQQKADLLAITDVEPKAVSETKNAHATKADTTTSTDSTNKKRKSPERDGPRDTASSVPPESSDSGQRRSKRNKS